jgi:hypothetical protein
MTHFLASIGLRFLGLVLEPQALAAAITALRRFLPWASAVLLVATHADKHVGEQPAVRFCKTSHKQ